LQYQSHEVEGGPLGAGLIGEGMIIFEPAPYSLNLAINWFLDEIVQNKMFNKLSPFIIIRA